MNSSNNNLDDERIKQQRREAAARRRAAKQRAQARENTEAAQQSQPRRRAQQPANRQQAASNQQPTQRRQQAANRQQAAGNQQAAKRKQAAGQQQPAARTQRRQQAGAPSDQQRTQRSQGAASRAQQPASRQQPRQRNSVRADADRQQQRSQQQQVRQQQRAQQQQAHRQQMREQTMREHQQRMQQQRNQYGKGAYSAANYAGRNGATRAAVATAGAHTQAPRSLNESMEQARRKRRRRTIIIAVIAAVILVLGGGTAAFAMSAKNAKDKAQDLMTQGQNLVSQVKAGDMQNAKTTAADFATSASDLNKITNNPLWAVATVVPVYGSDINQVRTLASAADMLSQKVLIPVVGNLPSDGLASIVVDGGFNVSLLQNLVEPIGTASQEIHEYAIKMESFDEPHISQLKGPMSTVKNAFEALDSVSGQAKGISDALPGMMGVTSPRTYLLVACTEAELRSTGGFPGSAGIMTVDNGKISIGDFSSPIPKVPISYESDVANITDEERSIFGSRVARYYFDSMFIPDFPRAATLMKEIWEANGNDHLDGLVCVDPVFLQRILALTGGVTTSGGTTVDGSNAAEMLMNSAYIMFNGEGEEYHRFFSEVAGHAMSQVFGNIGSVDLMGFAKTLLQSFEDKRIYAWMANEQEENVLRDLGWSNAVSTSETAPETGVYFGAALGCKVYWYLATTTSVSDGRKNADGSTSYDVTVKLDNTLSNELAATLPKTVVADFPQKRSAGDMITDIYIYAPAGGSISNMQANGYFLDSSAFTTGWETSAGPDSMTKTSYNGREVWYGITGIDGGTDTTITYTVTTSPKATDPLKVDMTPLADVAKQVVK